MRGAVEHVTKVYYEYTAGTSGMATAMTQFMGSTMNKSGLTAMDMQTLINHLNTSNGTIQ